MIKCETVALNADGKLIRGKEAINNPNTVKVLDDERVELTMYWEISVDLEAYYKHALPRLDRVIKQVSKGQIGGSVKRYMGPKRYGMGNTEYYTYITNLPLMREGHPGTAILSYLSDSRVYLGSEDYFEIDLSSSGVSKDSPWRLDVRQKSILLAIERRGNADRSECDFDIYELDYETYSKALFEAPSIVFPDFKFSIFDRNQEVMSQRKISVFNTSFGPKGPSFLIANNQNQNVESCLIPSAWIPDGKRFLMGIAKVYRDNQNQNDNDDPFCITISPEFLVERGDSGDRSDPYGSTHQQILTSNSLIMEIKEEFTKEQLQNLSEVRMQPISRNPN